MLPDSWLVVRLSALGDVVLTTGVLDRWHKERGWTFTFLTFSQWAPVLEGHPAIKRVIAVDKKDFSPKRMVGLFRKLSSELQGHGLLDLHGSLRARMLRMSWTGPARHYPKYAFARRMFLKSKGRMFREKLLRYNVPQRYALAVDRKAPARDELLPKLYLAEAELEHGRNLLSAAPQESSIIALHPFSTHPNKAWRIDHWRTLATQLLDAGHTVISVGVGESPFAGMDGILDFTNKTSLREVCALLGEADLLVTGDSGPMHLASGMQTPVVGLFGPTHRVWGFYPEGPNDVIVESELECRPCSLHGKDNCEGGHRCMESILPERVLGEVERLLARL